MFLCPVTLWVIPRHLHLCTQQVLLSIQDKLFIHPYREIQGQVHIFVMKFILFPVFFSSFCFWVLFVTVAISVNCICVLYHIVTHELSFKTVIEYMIKFESGKHNKEQNLNLPF